MPERLSLRSPRTWGRQPWLVVVGFAAAGAGCGVLWEALWQPPVGTVVDGSFRLDGAGLRADFAATGSYVLIAVLVGLVLGVVVALLPSRHEVLTLLLVAVGSLLAGWLMVVVGHALGPPDPEPLASDLPDGSRLPSDLEATGSAWVAFPAGALTGCLVIWWTVLRRPRATG